MGDERYMLKENNMFSPGKLATMGIKDVPTSDIVKYWHNSLTNTFEGRVWSRL